MSCPVGVTDTCPNVLAGTSGYLFLALINSFMQLKCSFDTKSMYPADYDCKPKVFDFIVVGGGTAGTVMANRLTENPNVTVLLIEAGGLPIPTNDIPALALDRSVSTLDWNSQTISPGMCLGLTGSCIWPRGKVLGGCSSINAMLYTRGRKIDYDDWESAGNVGWNYESALYYFKKSEGLQSDIHDKSLHGLTGPQTTSPYFFPRKIRTGIYDAARELGYPVTIDAPDIGYYEVLMNIENGKRCNNARAFISKIKDRKNLYLSTNTMVDKILFRNKLAYGVSVSKGKCGSNYIILAKKEVILSAGATGSPELLLKSDIGPNKSVANLAVGENLQDHLINLGITVKFNSSVADPTSPYDTLDMVYEYFLKNRGPLATLDLINLMGFIDTTNSSNNPDIEMMHNYYPQNDHFNLPNIPVTVGMGKEINNYLIEQNKMYNMLTLAPIILKPKSIGRMTLNAEGKLQIYPNFLDKEEDVQTMLRAVDYIKRFLQTQTMRSFGAELVQIPLPAECGEFDTEQYWRCHFKYFCGSIFHSIGTCKMGPKTDKNAVVSPELKVYGVSNLRVVDASIMPTHVTAHTNAPTTMVAEKAADIVKKQHGL